MNDSGEIVAIKKVIEEKQFKNRELSILNNLNHPNII
jgi:glycogen synthase kinase 3 beta